MTINKDHGIQHAPLKRVLDRLSEAGLSQETSNFCFVVPTSLQSEFRKQNIVTQGGNVHKKPGQVARVAQNGFGVDAFRGGFAWARDQAKKYTPSFFWSS